MVRLLLLARDCPDAAWRAKGREEGPGVEKARQVAGNSVSLIGGVHSGLQQLYIQGKRGGMAGKVGSDQRSEQTSHTGRHPRHPGDTTEGRMLVWGLRPGKELQGRPGLCSPLWLSGAVLPLPSHTVEAAMAHDLFLHVRWPRPQVQLLDTGLSEIYKVSQEVRLCV